jgi:hypothetical protein
LAKGVYRGHLGKSVPQVLPVQKGHLDLAVIADLMVLVVMLVHLGLVVIWDPQVL